METLELYGLPRLHSWHALIKESRLNLEMFPNYYSYASGYAHSEYLSMLQLSQMSASGVTTNIQTSLTVAKMIIALCIDFYVKNYKSAEIIYQTYPTEMRSAVKMFIHMGLGKPIKF